MNQKIDCSVLLPSIAFWSLRLTLAAGFLSAVADRFGLWGTPGAPHVSWGDWAHFVGYTALLNAYLPAVLAPLVGAVATALEVALALGLILGIWPRAVAFASAALLLVFALSMTLALGPKAPLDYSVFTGAAAAFLLGTHAGRNGPTPPAP